MLKRIEIIALKKSLFRVLWLALLIYSCLCIFLYIFQRNLLYFPTPAINHGYSEITINSQGEVIKVIVLNPLKQKAIIYFGGNAEAVAYSAKDFKNIFSEYSTYLVNFRGYGGSSGSPTEQGLFADAVAIYDQLSSQHSEIAVVGRSLGSGVASFLASKRNVTKLVLITPFDSIAQVAKYQYPLFPIEMLLADKYDSASYAPLINAPTLVLIATKDRVIPRERSEQLVKLLEQVHVKLIEQAGHNDISYFPEYSQSMSQFLLTGE